jgi:hypothetical protein
MGEDGAGDGERRLGAVIRRARARLQRVAGRELLIGKTWWVLGAGAVAAASRPLLWRLADEAPLWTGFARALGLFVAGSVTAAGALLVAGRRRGPSDVGAARAVDEALGHAEIVASGFAFERDDRVEPVALLARRRAQEAAAEVREGALFPLPSLRPSPRKAARFALGAALALGVGGYDRGLSQALLAPPTVDEKDAAAELSEAAAELADRLHREPAEPGPERASPRRERSEERLSGAGPSLADKAREAARAARRGDRKGALEKLDEVRNAGSKQAARAGDLGATLRRVAEALAPPSSQPHAGSASKPVDPGAGAAESMRLLARKMRSPEGASGGGEESKDRVLERLERAGEEARRAAGEGKSAEAGEAARALSRAAEALRRGDREAAAQALDQAAARAGAMEQARAEAAAEAMAIAEMLEKSGALEHAIQMAMLGREGEGKGEGAGEKGEGAGEKGEGEGGQRGKDGKGSGALRSAILARLVAMGVTGEPDAKETGSGSGPHVPDRRRAHREPLAAQGSIRAPSQVTEGARAIQAINGLGRGTEPPASYREVFPSYDAAAEEGIADERIPAQRRSAVRRYFETIRPGK